MSEDNVFEGSPCEMTPVPPVPPGHMIINPVVPDAPPDIPDCGDAQLDPLPPETPDPPCPSLTVGTATMLVNGEPAAINFTIDQGDCCDFVFNLEIDVDVTCPTINPTGTPITQPIPFTSGESSLTFVFTATEDCEFTLDIDIEIHCPQLDPATSGPLVIPFTDGPSELVYGFTSTGDCDYSLDIDIVIHCPAMSPASTSADVLLGDSSTGSITYGFSLDGDCDYSLDIEIIAPCGTITPVGTQVVQEVTFSETPELKYVFTLSPGCEYSLSIELTVPCPTFSVDWDVITLPAEDEATVTVSVDVDDPATCGVQFFFDFGIPRGPQGYQGFQGRQGHQGQVGECPVLAVGAQEIDVLEPEDDPYIVVDITPGIDPCTYEFGFQFGLPPGEQGEQGFQGEQGDQGDQGAQGDQGDQGAQGADGDQGDQGFQGADGPQGAQGFQGDKLAIVPVTVLGVKTYVALFCLEMPEARFQDLITVYADRSLVDVGGTYIVSKRIDHKLIQACEPDSLEVVAVVPDRPTSYGAVVRDNVVEVTFPVDSPAKKFNVTVSGVRLGYSQSRFRQHTEEDAERNKRWWSGWRNY